jgi:hypothetical protein
MTFSATFTQISWTPRDLTFFQGCISRSAAPSRPRCRGAELEAAIALDGLIALLPPALSESTSASHPLETPLGDIDTVCTRSPGNASAPNCPTNAGEPMSQAAGSVSGRRCVD